MSKAKRSFQDLNSEEKLTIIDDYLHSLGQTDHHEMLTERMEWLRRHIPAYKGEDNANFVFISYSHKDFKQVYSDLAFFSYNNKKKVRFWYDEGLPAGDDWFAMAKKQLCDVHCVGVIFYLSENLLRSPAVLQEIEMVKSLNKSYFTISLETNKFCAEDYLDPVKDAALLEKVAPVFPRNDTAVVFGLDAAELFPKTGSQSANMDVYDDTYENVLYRIDKIDQAFSVTEEIFSDFVFEQVTDGLCLREYRGNDSVVHLPARIGKSPLVEIRARLDNAIELYIPGTVKRILPVEIPEEEIGFDQKDQNSWSLEGVLLDRIGGYHSPGALFGPASNLTNIFVSPSNPVFYDVDGVLYSRDEKLVRFPAKHAWDEKYVQGIKTIGLGAFYGCHNSDINVTLPESVEYIEANAFAYAKVFCIFPDNVKEIGESAFAHCWFADGVLPLMLPSCLEKIGDFAFRDLHTAILAMSGSQLTELSRGACFEFNGECINLPDSLKIIHQGAFALCSNLEGIKLPQGLLGIDHYAFTECRKLYSIKLPQSLRYLSAVAFDTNNILKHIFFGGNSRDFYYFRRENEIEYADYLHLMITKDQWLTRLRAHANIKARAQAIKKLEKLHEPSSNANTIGTRRRLAKLFTLPTILSFLVCAAFMFVADYRRIVLDAPVDWIYWGLNAIAFLCSYTGSRPIYWSGIVGKHKKDAKNTQKPKLGYFDAWLSVAMISIVCFAILALAITIITAGIFDHSFFQSIFA